MANFVYNPHSGESHFSQWKRYLQQQEYAADITSAIRSQTKAYKTEIEKASKAVASSIDEAAREQAKAIADAANVVVGRLDQGFSELSGHLSEINASINELGTMLDWKLSHMIEQQRISNLLLENVAVLLRIPDVQKERQYYIEQGFKHYKNAALDGDLYEDALDNLLKAEKLEKTDYIVLHFVGMIYLYSPQMLDQLKAEAYLRKAAKYAVVESDPNAERIFNILLGDINKPLAEQRVLPDAPKLMAAKSYFHAGVACYTQGKFADAIELSDKAFSLDPTLLEAGFMKAKALAANGAEAKAVEVLVDVIKAERFYAVKTTTDGDLAPKSSVQYLLEKLRYDAVNQAKARIAKCKATMLPDSEGLSLITKAETLAQRNTYLDALAALDILTRRVTWKLNYLRKYSKSIEASLESFIAQERNLRREAEEARVRDEAAQAAQQREVKERQIQVIQQQMQSVERRLADLEKEQMSSKIKAVKGAAFLAPLWTIVHCSTYALKYHRTDTIEPQIFIGLQSAVVTAIIVYLILAIFLFVVTAPKSKEISETQNQLNELHNRLSILMS